MNKTTQEMLLARYDELRAFGHGEKSAHVGATAYMAKRAGGLLREMKQLLDEALAARKTGHSMTAALL